MLDQLRKHRLQKLNLLKEKGIPPYPHRYLPKESIASILERWQEERQVRIAGRIMAIREHGKSAFLDLRDSTAKIQVYFRKDILGDEGFQLFRECIDIGDIIGAEGKTFKTKTGEPTILADKFQLLSKSLLPLPEKWHGLRDVEIRYRKRYLDLIMNEEVRKVFILRCEIINLIRKFFNERGFMEVETPMLHPIPGGATGKPFKTHLDVYDLELYLRIAPELYLKRLLVGGFEKVYEINRSFRNEGVSTRHNPEFTMLEAYWAYANYEDLMQLIEELFCYLAQEIKGGLEFEYQGRKISFRRPWNKLSFAQILGRQDLNIDTLREVMEEKLGKRLERLSRSQVLKLCEEYIEGMVGYDPVFVIDHLKEVSPLAKAKEDSPNLVERFELFIAGIEIANAYSELNDPIEQRRRFEEQAQEDLSKVDYDYVEALEYGMPPAGGLGIGIDRVLMIFADVPSIREVLLFPLLKPEGFHEA